MVKKPNPTQSNQDSLVTQSFDLTVLGVILTCIIYLIDGRINGQSVVIICSFVACAYLWKIIWPLDNLRRYKWWQAFSVCGIGFFGWWLIYSAENTRAGWYRFNVLQRRVQSFVRHAPAYIVAADCDGYITATSDNIAELCGWTPSELLGQQLTILMRDGPAAKHQVAYDKAVQALRDTRQPDSGWMLQGLIVVGVKHKDGHVVPVKAYAGGIRWSTDIQFKGDIDMFACLVPATLEEAMGPSSTVNKRSQMDELKVAPGPPPVPTLSPVPTPYPVPTPPGHNPNEGSIIRNPLMNK